MNEEKPKPMGLQKAKIVSSTLKIIPPKNTPLVEIGFAVKGYEKIIPLKLWMSQTIISKGFNQGKTPTEVALDTLEDLDFNGANVSDLGFMEVGDLFDTNKEFTINVVFQRKDGEVLEYLEVSYLIAGHRHQALTREQVHAGFSNIDSMWKKKKINNFKENDPPF